MTNRITPAVASARKSLGEYKPLIKFGDGRTQVVETNPDRMAVYTKHGRVEGNRYARGATYTNRADAIAAAQKAIDEGLAAAIAHYAKVPHRYNVGAILIYGGTDPAAD